MPTKPKSFRPAHLAQLAPASSTYSERADPTLPGIYWSAPWKRFRATIRRSRVLCERCKAQGIIKVGKIVHHLIDPRDDPSRTYDPTNVQLVCQACHNQIHADDAPRARPPAGPSPH